MIDAFMRLKPTMWNFYAVELALFSRNRTAKVSHPVILPLALKFSLQQPSLKLRMLFKFKEWLKSIFILQIVRCDEIACNSILLIKICMCHLNLLSILFKKIWFWFRIKVCLYHLVIPTLVNALPIFNLSYSRTLRIIIPVLSSIYHRSTMLKQINGTINTCNQNLL